MKRVKILLGKRIKELRGKKGWSQQYLSDIININQKNLSKIECGTVFPSKYLDKLADAFEIKLSEIFEFEHLEYSVDEKKNLVNSMMNKFDEEKINLMYKIAKTF